jgi:hypothetical protein
LRVHEVLHLVGPADVGEALLAVLATRLDEQVAGAEHALEDALVEVDVVHALEGISMPLLAMTPARKMSRCEVMTKLVVSHLR